MARNRASAGAKPIAHGQRVGRWSVGRVPDLLEKL